MPKQFIHTRPSQKYKRFLLLERSISKHLPAQTPIYMKEISSTSKRILAVVVYRKDTFLDLGIFMLRVAINIYYTQLSKD